MPSIPSAFRQKGGSPNGFPLVFQVLGPDLTTPLLPEYLFLHVNPANLDYSYQRNVNRVQTKGGFVEQHFGNELTGISASGSTGAFISVEHGVTYANRKDTIAYRKYLQLLDLFKSNGSVYDDRGNVQFRGRIRLVFAGGIFDGYFTDFSVPDTAEEPYSMTYSFSFKVEKESRSLRY